MNEAELIAKTIEVGQARGWASSYLTDPETGKHCLLGMIGYARWGNQWDIDCHQTFSAENGNVDDEQLYKQLQADPLTRQVIQRVADKIVQLDPSLDPGPAASKHDNFDGSYLNCVVYGWNDLLPEGEGEEDVMQLLEKVQADIG